MTPYVPGFCRGPPRQSFHPPRDFMHPTSPRSSRTSASPFRSTLRSPRAWLLGSLMAGAVLGCGLQAHPGAEPPIEMPDTGGSPSSSTGGNPSSNTGGTGSPTDTGGKGSPSGGSSGTGGSSSGHDAGTSATGGSGRDAGVATGGTPATGTGGAAPSGAGLTINGTFVPKEKAVAFIHFGHSNMRGYATTPSSLRSYFFDTVPGLWSYKGSFTAAKEPTAPETGTQTQAGPGMAILHSAKAAAASDVQFISIGYGIGSKTSVDYQKGGLYYPIFMKWANALKGNVTFGGIVIMLGITDGEHLPTAQVPAFPSRVAQLVSDIRADLGEPNLPVLFCDYEQNATGTLAPTGSVGMVMQPLVRMLPGMISKLVLVPTDGIEMQDDHHFDMQGHKTWADRVIMLMQTNGWFPWK